MSDHNAYLLCLPNTRNEFLNHLLVSLILPPRHLLETTWNRTNVPTLSGYPVTNAVPICQQHLVSGSTSLLHVTISFPVAHFDATPNHHAETEDTDKSSVPQKLFYKKGATVQDKRSVWQLNDSYGDCVFKICTINTKLITFKWRQHSVLFTVTNLDNI
jgi:hypothetical protein